MILGIPWWIYPLGIALIAFAISEWCSQWKEWMHFKKWEEEMAARNTDGSEHTGAKKVQFKGEPKRGAVDKKNAERYARERKLIGRFTKKRG